MLKQMLSSTEYPVEVDLIYEKKVVVANENEHFHVLCNTNLELLSHDKVCIPQPRRVTSPKNIMDFYQKRDGSYILDQSTSSSYSSYNDTIFDDVEEIQEIHDNENYDDEDDELYGPEDFAIRPDVYMTSPPMRAGNPIIMDSRFCHTSLKGLPITQTNRLISKQWNYEQFSMETMPNNERHTFGRLSASC